MSAYRWIGNSDDSWRRASRKGKAGRAFWRVWPPRAVRHFYQCSKGLVSRVDQISGTLREMNALTARAFIRRWEILHETTIDHWPKRRLPAYGIGCGLCSRNSGSGQ